MYGIEDLQEIGKVAATSPQGWQILNSFLDRPDVTQQDVNTIGQAYQEEKKLAGYRQAYGVSSLPDRGLIGEAVHSLGVAATDVIPMGIAQIMQGSDVPLEDKESFWGRMIQRQKEDMEKDVPSRQYVLGDWGHRSVKEGIESGGLSVPLGIAGFGAGTLAGAGASAVAGPAGGLAAGTATAMAVQGAGMYRQAKNEFLRTVRDELTKNYTVLPEQWDAIKEQVDADATQFGLWEAGPEAVSEGLSYLLFKAPVGRLLAPLLGKGAGKKILAKTLSGIGKYTGTLATEIPSEAATQLGQENILGVNPYTRGAHEIPEGSNAERYWESLKDVAGPTAVATGLLGAGYKGVDMLANRLSKPKPKPRKKTQVNKGEIVTKLRQGLESGEISLEQLREVRDGGGNEELTDAIDEILMEYGSPQTQLKNQTEKLAQQNQEQINQLWNQQQKDPETSFKEQSQKSTFQEKEKQGIVLSGKTSETFLNDNTRVDTQFSVVSGDDLITSHNDDLTLNNNFPQVLQPRDRKRDAMRLQIDEIANKLNPERLRESANAGAGAPIIGEDMIVESGNGRTLAIRKAYQKPGISKYRRWLYKNAESFGFDPKEIAKIKNPVLVRRRLTDLDRADFTRKANQDEIAAMSPAELARADADIITAGDLSVFAPSENGNLSAPSNRTFLGRFTNKLGKSERSGLITADGQATKQLIDRVQAAVFHKAYKDNSLVELMAEEADPDIKNLIRGLTIAAPSFVKAGSIDPDMGNIDFLEKLLKAVKTIQNIKAKNERVDDYLNQQRIFNSLDPITEELIEILESNKRSPRKLGEFLKLIGSKLTKYLERRLNKTLPGFQEIKLSTKDLIEAAVKESEIKHSETGNLFADPDKKVKEKSIKVKKEPKNKADIKQTQTEQAKTDTTQEKTKPQKAKIEQELNIKKKTTPRLGVTPQEQKKKTEKETTPRLGVTPEQKSIKVKKTEKKAKPEKQINITDTPTEKELAAKIIAAYKELKEQEGLSDIEIDKIVEKAGLPLKEVQDWLLAQSRAGNAILSPGDWSLSSPETRAAAIKTENTERPYMQVSIKLDKIKEQFEKPKPEKEAKEKPAPIKEKPAPDWHHKRSGLLPKATEKPAAPVKKETDKKTSTDKERSRDKRNVIERLVVNSINTWKLAKQVKQWLDNGEKIQGVKLISTANRIWEGKQSQGAYTIKDAYDALEMGVNLHISETMKGFENPEKTVKELKALTERLPTQTKRTKEQIEFQQFSTPPALSYVANWVANITPNDVYLEPSAGVGGLATFGRVFKANKIFVNELSPRRADLIKMLKFDKVFIEDAEQLHNILPENIRPSIIVMNPPFSATGGRLKKNATKYGARHITQALYRLEPGGRLTAIVGQGMADNAASFQKFWKEIKQEYNVRANIRVSGKEYKKYGTTFDNQLLVIDKTGKTEQTITGKAETIEELIPLLKEIRDGRRKGTQSNGEKTESRAGNFDKRKENESGNPKGTRTKGSKQSADKSALRKNAGKSQRIGRRDVSSLFDSSVPGQGQRLGNTSRTGIVRPVSGRMASGIRTPNADNGILQSDRSALEKRSQRDGRSDNRRNGRKNDGRESGDRRLHTQTLPLLDLSKPKQPSKKEISDSLYDYYAPKTTIKGAKKHPTKLVQSAAMADTSLPDVSYKPNLPSEIVETGRLSDAQLEAVIYAGAAHEKMLANGERKGFFIGDGTGVGKGREISGIIYDNWRQGRKKAIWISETAKLQKDAQRDLEGIGWKEGASKVFPLNKTKLGKRIQKSSNGILFTTYSTVSSGFQEIRTDKPETLKNMRARINQIVDWVGKDFDGVIAFDESHNMGNATEIKNKRGAKKPAQKALAGLLLQDLLPKARVVYVSATGATEVVNLAYTSRLGLWGEGTPFSSKEQFVTSISAGGLAAMELVARDMKAMGVYIGRSLSYDRVKYRRLVHTLTPNQRTIYDELAKAWQIVLHNIDKALEETGMDKSSKKKDLYGRFWGTHQRFFNQVITSMQMPSVIQAIKKDLENGNAAILQLINTNEAQQERNIAKVQKGESLEDLDLTPRDALMEFLQKSFPIVQYEEYVDDNGNVKSRPSIDSNGEPVKNHQAIEMRDKLLAKIGAIRVPQGPLEYILDQLGTDNVAEVTGRSKRVVLDKQGKKIIEKWSPAKSAQDANDFMNDKKRVLVFSQAGGTGRSYHADKTAKNQRKRIHYLVQPGWRADVAVQGLGRSHRSNQAQPPEFVLVTTNLKGQKRFLSSVARRLDQLGALTKGQRQAGSSGIFQARDNLESSYARLALINFIEGLSGPKLAEFEKQTGLKISGDEGGPMSSNMPNIRQFLNRILSMEVNKQNETFAEFETHLSEVIEAHAKAGTLDIGIETIRGDKIEKKFEKIVNTDEKTGAQTKYIKLEITNPADNLSFNESKVRAQRYYQNTSSGRVWAASELREMTDQYGNVVQYRYLTSPGRTHQKVVEIDKLEKWEKLSESMARRLWSKEYQKLPKTVNREVHLITGTLLPIWDKLEGPATIYRLQTNEGERLLGRTIHKANLLKTLNKLGVKGEKIKLAGEQIVEKVLSGDTVRLSNEWKFQKKRVSGDYRIEIIGPDFSDLDALERMGVFNEQIDWKTRFFVPLGDKAGSIIEKIIKGKDVIQIDKGDYSLREPQINMESDTDIDSEKKLVKSETITKMKVTGWLKSKNQIKNSGDVASMFSFLSEAAQEYSYIIAIDKDGNVIEIHKHTKGTEDSAPVDESQIAGRLLKLSNIDTVFFLHNHPSGGLEPSSQDVIILKFIKKLLSLSDDRIKVKGIIIEDGDYVDFSDIVNLKAGKIRKLRDGKKVSIKERYLKPRNNKNVPSLNTSKKVLRAFKELYDNQDGFLFFDGQLRPTGFLPIREGATAKQTAAEVLKAAEKHNSRKIIIKHAFSEDQKKLFAQSLFFSNLVAICKKINFLDLLDENGNSLRHIHLYGRDITFDRAITEIRSKDKALFNTIFYDKSIKLSKTDFTLQDVQKLFKGQHVGLAPDRSIWVRTKAGHGVQIKAVDRIALNRIAFQAARGRMKTDGEMIAGKYQDNIISINKNFGDKYTLAHETVHWMEDAGIITPFEQNILKSNIKKLYNRGKWETQNKEDIGGKEDRAKFIENKLRSREEHTTAVKKVLKKIVDWLDALINIFKRTARAMVRDIESGKIFNRKSEQEAARSKKGDPLFQTKSKQEAARLKIESFLKEDPEFEDFINSIKGPDFSKKETLQESLTLLQKAKKRFGKGYVDQDMSYLCRAFGLPYWTGKKFKSMGRAVEIMIDKQEKTARQIHEDYSGDLGTTQEAINKDKELYNELEQLIWKWDGKEMPEHAVPSLWYRENDAGEISQNPEQYIEMEKFLIEQDVTEEVVNAYIAIRKILDEKYIDAMVWMEKEDIDPILIEEYRSQIDKIHNYFPHRRRGDSRISIIDKKTQKAVWIQHFSGAKERLLPEDRKAPARAKKWLENAIKNGELSGVLTSYSITKPQKVRKLPDQAFFQVPVEQMQQIAEEAGRRLESARAGYEAKRLYNKEGISEEDALKKAKKRLRADMEEALSKAIAEVFKARGWASHAIHRKGIRGFEQGDVFGTLFDYLSGYAGFKTKITGARELSKVVSSIDAAGNPGEYKHVSKYVRDMLTNSDKVDRAVDTARGLFFIKYLGFGIKSGIVNLTQNFVMAAPMLSLHTKGAHIKLTKAMADVRVALVNFKGKSKTYKNISNDEQKALDELIESGAATDLFLKELKGNLPATGWGKYIRKFVDWSGVFMRIAERFNRTSTGLAAYRVAKNEKGFGHKEAVQFAKKIIYDSHFLYGKSNMPTFVRGGDFQKIARAGYTFRSFTHNYLSAIAHLFQNKGWAGRKAVARSFLNVMLFGGLTALPFFKLFSGIFQRVIGDEGEEPMTKIRQALPDNSFIRDLVVYGLPGALGVDLTGSISIEVPRNWKDIIGVPYSIGEDLINMTKSFRSGAPFRAISETPITPLSVRNAMRAWELYRTGQRTRSGRDINSPGKPGPRKISLPEAFAKGVIGLQPVSVSKGYARYRSQTHTERYINDKKRAFADQYTNALRKNDYKEIVNIMAEIRNWNSKAEKEGKIYKKINIQKMIKSRLRPPLPAKRMRARAAEISEAWR